MVIVLHEVSSFTWDTFAFTVVPLAWLKDVGAYVRGERGVWGPSKALVPEALGDQTSSYYPLLGPQPPWNFLVRYPTTVFILNLMCGGPALVLG